MQASTAVSSVHILLSAHTFSFAGPAGHQLVYTKDDSSSPLQCLSISDGHLAWPCLVNMSFGLNLCIYMST